MPQRYLIVGITAFAALWLYIDRVCVSTLADDIQKDLGLAAPEKELMLGAFFFTYALFQIPMGSLADRFGARRVLAVSIAAWSLVMGGCGIKRMSESALTLLPQPDSPTRPSASPSPSVNDTPLTALTTPSWVKNCVRRSVTSSSGRFVEVSSVTALVASPSR